MSAAEEIREAAALVRERAEAATQDPAVWEHEGGGHMTGLINDDGVYGPLYRVADAEHIASWHPAVALAVAAWLDHEAQACGCRRSPFVEEGHALAHTLARAYLGRES